MEVVGHAERKDHTDCMKHRICTTLEVNETRQRAHPRISWCVVLTPFLPFKMMCIYV